MGAMIMLWILSTWYPAFDIYLVAVAGACLMFFPEINLFTWKEAQANIGWESLLMTGGVTSLGLTSSKSGLAKWIVDSALSGLHDYSLIWVLAIISAFTVAIHVLLPNNLVIIAVIIPPIILLGKAVCGFLATNFLAAQTLTLTNSFAECTG